MPERQSWVEGCDPASDKAFSGKVESGFPPQNAANRQVHLQEKPALI
jgi:hypothetical protein